MLNLLMPNRQKKFTNKKKYRSPFNSKGKGHPIA